jgi:hypothetical protein
MGFSCLSDHMQVSHLVLGCISIGAMFRMSCQDFVTINFLALLLLSFPILVVTVSLKVLVWE